MPAPEAGGRSVRAEANKTRAVYCHHSVLPAGNSAIKVPCQTWNLPIDGHLYNTQGARITNRWACGLPAALQKFQPAEFAHAKMREAACAGLLAALPTKANKTKAAA